MQNKIQKKLLFYILVIFCFTSTLQAQNNRFSKEECKIMFYNVENLFDTFNDTTTLDDEFTPESGRYWSEYKYYDKLQKTAKVIIAAGEWQSPAIVCLSEIENLFVLEGLINLTALKKLDYRIIHKDSPDLRGIDVAMLYRQELFQPISYNTIKIDFGDSKQRPTRDILYVKGRLLKKYRIHLFVNHWPSRYGGEVETIEKRKYVATVLKSKIDSIRKFEASARIIICGDFNDTPDNESIKETLGARLITDSQQSYLINLSIPQNKEVFGTNKYQGEWTILDQFIVSRNLLDGEIFIPENGFQIFSPDFLLEKDEAATGFRPRRTFIGMRYNGGFSDHLPVFINLKIKK